MSRLSSWRSKRVSSALGCLHRRYSGPSTWRDVSAFASADAIERRPHLAPPPPHVRRGLLRQDSRSARRRCWNPAARRKPDKIILRQRNVVELCGRIRFRSPVWPPFVVMVEPLSLLMMKRLSFFGSIRYRGCRRHAPAPRSCAIRRFIEANIFP